DAREPLILGSVGLRRGYLDFSGRRFTFAKGEVDFDKLSRNNPTVDMRAEYAAANNVTAAIAITGRAKSPSIALTSTPPLPTNDVMALVLFGKAATDLTALQSLQVAAALAQLSGAGPFGGSNGGISGLARRTLGLDLLSVDIGANAGESKLEIGKYVAQGLFISATQDAQGKNGSVRVQYEITPSISVETQLQQDGAQTASANWKHDF
ncbi:MAG TPA: translocation/assembly module TamB domain-containing protein, partial [Parvularculaceae bacterium]|nr:translocation/assembly module TamB domain-containing protein [Parvularculaceae bacterium]